MLSTLLTVAVVWLLVAVPVAFFLGRAFRILGAPLEPVAAPRLSVRKAPAA